MFLEPPPFSTKMLSLTLEHRFKILPDPGVRISKVSSISSLAQERSSFVAEI